METYHTPENLASLLVGEVGELSELCVWLNKEQIKSTIEKQVTEELADVVKGTIFLFNSLNIRLSLETLIYAKLDYETLRYQVEEFKGKSKYEKITPKDQKVVKPPKLPEKNIINSYSIEALEKRAWNNTVQRNWDKYYTPASLCLGISEDCSKIYTSFQRRTDVIPNSYEKLVWAIAGILILSMRFHKYLELDDLGEIVLKKIKKDFERFG